VTRSQLVSVSWFVKSVGSGLHLLVSVTAMVIIGSSSTVRTRKGREWLPVGLGTRCPWRGDRRLSRGQHPETRGCRSWRAVPRAVGCAEARRVVNALPRQSPHHQRQPRGIGWGRPDGDSRRLILNELCLGAMPYAIANVARLDDSVHVGRPQRAHLVLRPVTYVWPP
jgi:hypothetical protein